MPTHDISAAFRRDLDQLTPVQRKAFRAAVEVFIEDLRGKRGIRRGLKVRKMAGHDGIWEMTWAPDGRATFAFGEEQTGEVHVIWRRIGTHTIFGSP